MKRIVLAAVLTFFAAFTINPAHAVNAAAAYSLTESEASDLISSGETVYARVFTDDVPLCLDENLTDVLFLLPATYYVKVTEYSPVSCRVIYCYEDYDYARGVFGYVDTALLTFVAEPPAGKSFPNVFPEFEGNGTFWKNNRFETYYSAADSPKTSDAFFYGYYPSAGERYCYVLRGGKFGYYSADVFGRIDIPPHPDPKPLTRTAPASESAPEKAEKSGFFSSDANRVLFVAVICVIAISAVYLVFLPKRRGEPLPGDDDEKEIGQD